MLTETILQDVPESIGEMTNLMLLDISENPITELPETIANLKNLKTLKISRTQIQKLPEFLGQLPHLEKISLDGIEMAADGIPKDVNAWPCKFFEVGYDQRHKFPVNCQDKLNSWNLQNALD